MIWKRNFSDIYFLQLQKEYIKLENSKKIMVLLTFFLPSYRVPSGYQNVPWPYFTPCRHSPSYRAPFLNTYKPRACLNPLQYWPTYISPFGSNALPRPCLSPFSFRSPSYNYNYITLRFIIHSVFQIIFNLSLPNFILK